MNRLTQKITEAISLLRNRQYFRCLSRLCATCLPAGTLTLGKSYLLALDVSKLRDLPPPVDYAVRQVGAGDLDAIMACSDDHSGMGSHALFDSYFRAGHACYVIQEGTAILGYLWVFADSYRMAFGGGNGDEVRLVFSPSVAFVGNVFVNPVRRRQGLYRQLLRGMAIDESRRRGIREVVVVVKASNTVSVCAHQGNGFEITSTVYCISLRVLAFLVAIPAKGRPWLCRITNGRSLAYECLSGSTASERVLPPANSNAKPRER